MRHRQSFHDGVYLAQLLVAVRQTLDGKKADPLPHVLARLPHGLVRLLVAVQQAWKADPGPDGPLQLLVAVRQILKADPLPRPQKALQIATAIAGDSSYIAGFLPITFKPGKPSGQKDPPPMIKRLRTRRWPRQYSTPSWPAAYNLACVYAAIYSYRHHQPEACMRKPEDNQAQLDAEQNKDELPSLARQVVTSLEFAINNPECEMDYPSEWIDNDPDFGCLKANDQFFKGFLDAQKGRDYSPSPNSAEPRSA